MVFSFFFFCCFLQKIDCRETTIRETTHTHGYIPIIVCICNYRKFFFFSRASPFFC